MLDGREPKSLVYAKPDDSLAKVVSMLAENKCSMSPVLSCDPQLGTRKVRVSRPRGFKFLAWLLRSLAESSGFVIFCMPHIYPHFL